MRGLLIPSGEDPIEERTLASLPDHQYAVGGWIEAIDLPDVGLTIYVNEEGLLQHVGSARQYGKGEHPSESTLTRVAAQENRAWHP